MNDRSSRRQFLQRSALTAGTLFLSGWKNRRSPRKLSANDRLQLGVVGVAGVGRTHLEGCIREDVVALCDVDVAALDDASRSLPKASVHTDFRRMLDQESLDGVVIGTADHTHAVIAIQAIQAGCHVFCTDPLTRTVSEARAVATMARRRGSVTQMGGSLVHPAIEREVIRQIQAGVLGTVTDVHAWSSKTHGELNLPQNGPATPSNVDYDLWLGPVSRRPFRSDYLGGRWRHWWQFGGGTLTDAGSSYFSLVHRATSVAAPTQIHASGPPLHLENTPSWLKVRYTYSRKEPQPPLELTWYHGGMQPADAELEGFEKVKDGLLFRGTAGKMLVSASGATLLLKDHPAQSLTVSDHLTETPDRLCEWLEACKGVGKGLTECPFDLSAGVAEAVHLGNVAYRTDRKLAWDSRKMIASNLPDASEYLQHNYRFGWWI